MEYMLHDIHSENEQIYDDELSETMGRTETFNFTIAPTHPNIDKIKTFTSEIKIYQDGKVIFFGRSITPQWDMYNTNTVQCVGGMSYLADSMQAPFELTGNIDNLITQLLAVHNSMVTADKRFQKGIVNVAGTFITRTLENYTPTLDVLHNLLDDYNGYLRSRKENGINYLDFVSDYGGINSQVIRFGQNILDVQKGADAGELITCLIPEGDSIDITNPDGTTGSKVVDITSVNGGKKYIESVIGVTKWGRIFGYAKFEGITDPTILLQEATTYLENKILLPETIELTALDLSHMDTTVDAFKLGHWTQCESKPHKLSGTYLLKKMLRHLTAPQNDKIILGETRKTLTGAVADTAKNLTIQIGKVKQSTSKEIEQKVNNASKLITGGLGGYVVIGLNAEDGHPEEILIMDAPTKEAAVNLLRFNKNGIGFSNDGYNGTYRNAWTIDGNLVADFITTGSMLADRIKGGTLELGGTGLGKDGSIVVKNALGTQIGYWDKTGLHISKGIITGGSIDINNGTFRVTEDGEVTISTGTLDIGPLYADDGGVQLGDYRISVNGTNEFISTNDWVKINANERPSGSPGGGYASLTLSGQGYGGVEILGTGGIDCADVKARNCNLAHGSGRVWYIGETIDWFWEQFQDLKDRVDNL